MKKIEYKAPTMEIIKLDYKRNILQGLNQVSGGDGEEFGGGGEGF